MTRRTQNLLAAVVIVVLGIVAAQGLHAQAIFTNPPCANVAVVNNSPCNVRVNFSTAPLGVWAPFTMPPGTARFLSVPATGVRVFGVITPAGPVAALNPPPPPVTSPCTATSWWATNLPLDPTNPACTVTVCVDPANCSITFW